MLQYVMIVTITNINDVKSNTELMTYITAQWHST